VKKGPAKRKPPAKRAAARTKASTRKAPAKTGRIRLPLDRWLNFDELTDLLHRWADRYPDLITVSSIGKTNEGRNIWICTVTDTSTGPHDTKPAVWVDANIHATEHTGGAAALNLLDRLLRGFKRDEKVTRALRTRTFYVVPRLSADGVEESLQDNPRWVRSSTREWPWTEQRDGLIMSDVDGDGRILAMRIRDDNGTWTPSEEDARLLVPRDADDDGPGPYYRLISEGTIQNYDGVTIRSAPPLAGLDINRNYPHDWRPGDAQTGAGPFPTSEPEIRALVEAVVARPNICTYIQYHTASAVHLRPWSGQGDDKFPTFDLRLFKALGDTAEELTGYKMVSVYHGFRYDPKDVITGVSLDWAYDHLGLLAFVTEFWSPLKRAGIERDENDPLEWARKHPVEDDVKLLKWIDEHVPGGFVDWYEFDHPQLGPLEIGGFDGSMLWRNPPLAMVEEEITRHADWAIHNALITPRLTLREATATPIGDGTWRVRFVVQNAGWLPTQVTQKAVERRVVRPIEMEIELPKGAEVVGDSKVEIGQLSGRALRRSTVSGAMDGTGDVGKVDWVVTAPAGAEIGLVARHQRAGVVRANVVLG
jgi:murein tripeptide amidase MpaA